ncbi:hypothetical protein F5887DRAFT_926923 [Amanita rubescens]|nr:hypothetical protein F5887DRAFT_926923 [Amanita rubescens]
MAHEEECHTAQAAKGQGQRTRTREGNPRMRRNAGSRTQKQEAVHEKGGMLGGARLERTGTAHQNEGVHKRGGTPDRKVGHSRNGWDAGKRTWESQRFERRPEGVHGKGGMPDRKAGPFEERLKGRQKNAYIRGEERRIGKSAIRGTGGTQAKERGNPRDLKEDRRAYMGREECRIGKLGPSRNGVHKRGGTPDRKVGHSRNGWDVGKRTWESQRFERRPEGVHGKGGMPDRKAGPFEERLKGRQKNRGGTPDRKVGHSRNGWDVGKRTWESQRFERRPEGVHGKGGMPDRKAGPFEERLKGRQKNRGGTPDRKVGHSRNGWDAGKRTWESQRFERRPEGVHGKGGMPDRKAGPFEERLKGRQKNESSAIRGTGGTQAKEHGNPKGLKEDWRAYMGREERQIGKLGHSRNG